MSLKDLEFLEQYDEENSERLSLSKVNELYQKSQLEPEEELEEIKVDKDPKGILGSNFKKGDLIKAKDFPGYIIEASNGGYYISIVDSENKNIWRLILED